MEGQGQNAWQAWMAPTETVPQPPHLPKPLTCIFWVGKANEDSAESTAGRVDSHTASSTAIPSPIRKAL